MGGETIGEECKPARQQRHILLDESIQLIDHVTENVDDLISKISGNYEPEKDNQNKVRTVPSLAQVLSDAPASIDQKCKVLHEKIEQIRELLF